MKNLKVIYDGNTLFDGDIDEFIFSDARLGVKLEGRIEQVDPPRAANSAAGGSGLLGDIIAGISKAKTAGVVAEKRAEAEIPEVSDAVIAE